MSRCKTVTPMSEMIDVFVEYERLGVALEALRGIMVHKKEEVPIEWFDARHHGRQLLKRLDDVRSLLSLYEMGAKQRAEKAAAAAEPPSPEPPPKGPPNFKLVS